MELDNQGAREGGAPPLTREPVGRTPPSNMPAYFSVHRVFHLTGTGPVVAGHILEGVIRSGMVAALDERPEHGPWRIGDVGFADNVAQAKRYVLLTFPTVILVDDLCTALPPGSVLTISYPDP